MKTRIIEVKGSFQIQHQTKFLWWTYWADSRVDRKTQQNLMHEECDHYGDYSFPKARFYNKYYAEWLLYPTRKYDHLSINVYRKKNERLREG